MKKSVNAGVLRRSSTTTSTAFLSSAARTALATSPVNRFFAARSDPPFFSFGHASDLPRVCAGPSV